jgi:replicative DNA helicase
MATEPERFAPFVADLGAGTVVIDSLKDVALDLSKDETGARLNAAFQLALAEGIEVSGIHHQRKASAGNPKPRSLSDVYGSVWITSGAGSVLLVWGEPGDSVVEISHLKQPLEDVGPLKILHDHRTGRSTIHEGVDLVATALLDNGVTAQSAAQLLYETATPNRNQVERARRRLELLVRSGSLARREQGPGEPVKYLATDWKRS